MGILYNAKPDHLVMVPRDEGGLRAALGEAHRRYTRHINFQKGWRGHLWQERFHSFTMDEKYLISAVRYIERNPVAAKLCVEPQDWAWSSARAHLSGVDDILVQVKPMLNLVGNWKEYLAGEETLNSIDAVKQHSRTGRPLGSQAFIGKLEELTGKDLAPKKPGRKMVDGK